MSPIILKNSHSHSFIFTDVNGDTKEVTVLRGQDIAPLGIPLKQLTRIMNEYVVTFDGSSERPRYEMQDDPVDPQQTYSSGPTSQALVTRSLAKQRDETKPRLSPEELVEMQRAAEQAEERENQMKYREEDELRRAETERVAREAAEATDRAAAAEARATDLEARLAAAEATAAKAASATQTPSGAKVETSKPSGGKNK